MYGVQDKKQNTRKPRKKQVKTHTKEEKEDKIEFEESTILKNAGACLIIMELVNIFTSNSTLPERQLNILRFSLLKKVAAVIANLLNSFVGVVTKEVIEDLSKNPLPNEKPIMVNASCQTQISGNTFAERF